MWLLSQERITFAEKDSRKPGDLRVFFFWGGSSRNCRNNQITQNTQNTQTTQSTQKTNL